MFAVAIFFVCSLGFSQTYADCINPKHSVSAQSTFEYKCTVRRDESDKFKLSDKKIDGQYRQVCKGCGCLVEAHTNK